jgi:hypothetical protein
MSESIVRAPSLYDLASEQMNKPDPTTDKATAEAFTAEHKHTRARYSSSEPTIFTHLNDERRSCRCWGETAERGRITRWHQCGKPAKVTLADGSTWCGVHSPQAVERRKEQARKRDAENDAASRRRMAQWRFEAKRNSDFPKLLDALRQIARGHNDPRTLAAEVLADWPEPAKTDDRSEAAHGTARHPQNPPQGDA